MDRTGWPETRAWGGAIGTQGQQFGGHDAIGGVVYQAQTQQPAYPLPNGGGTGLEGPVVFVLGFHVQGAQAPDLGFSQG